MFKPFNRYAPLKAGAGRTGAKSEIRISKSETNGSQTNLKSANSKHASDPNLFRSLNLFFIRICFGFRISCFGFTC